MSSTKLHVPIRQAEDEELHEGRLQQQLLVFGAEVAETRDVLCPFPDHLHGGRQQVVELPDVVGVFFLAQVHLRLIVLRSKNTVQENLNTKALMENRT